MGRPLCRNFASMTFFNSTFLDPLASRTFSSFGRLKADVCTPRRASPAVNASWTTRIGDSNFRLKFFCASGIGRLRSMSGRCCAYTARRALSALSRTVTKDSNAAL